ncbi:MAG: hypothetical protein CL758_07010 [Chloroflexi bacterium]|nr:hypothetical protein [Chloroflexota bacterium]
MSRLSCLSTSIIILFLIGCSSMVGQGTPSEQDSAYKVNSAQGVSAELNDVINGMDRALRIEFNQLIELGESLNEKERELLLQLNEELSIGEEFDRLNQEMAANSQNEIDDLKKRNLSLIEELGFYLQELEGLRNDLDQYMTELSELERDNSKLSEEIQMFIIQDTDLINQLNQKENEIAILKDQLEQKANDELQKNTNSS